MQNGGPELLGTTSLCPRLPSCNAFYLGPQGRHCHRNDPGGVRAEEWPMVTPTVFISNAIHRWEIGGCIHHIELSCGPAKEATAFLGHF